MFCWVYTVNIFDDVSTFAHKDKKKSILKLYLLRQKWTMNEMFIFFKIIHLAFNKLIPVSFLLIKAPLKILLFFFVMMRSYAILFLCISVMSSNLIFEINFQLRKQCHMEPGGSDEYSSRGACYTCTILYFTKNI